MDHKPSGVFEDREKPETHPFKSLKCVTNFTFPGCGRGGGVGGTRQSYSALQALSRTWRGLSSPILFLKIYRMKVCRYSVLQY